ncbi:MAG: PP2C family protein-serine/threonine phosphatase [Eubacteriales bacterium]|nr:PP2C family protein-serine/threonine phosphatase [Eubacteriales bacterium]
MKSKTADYDALQSAYLLEYDRRRILNCADTFENLAAVFAEMNRDEDGNVRDREGECDREAAWRMKRAQENRRHYASYMKQLAGLMQAVAGTSVQMIRLGGRKEKQIFRALDGEGIIVQDIFLLRGQKDKLEISVSLCTKKDTSVTIEEIAGYLSVLMDIRLMPEKRNPYFVGKDMVNLYFEEEPAYCCMTAAATAVKENETVSGDCYSFFEEDDAVTMILSDGVGSGESAAKDSSRIVDLTEQILDAGLGEKMAVQMLNGMVGTEGDETHMATLDVCRVDLMTGECALIKAGAASTFIKRGDQVERVSSDTLPLGMMAEEEEKEMRRQLKDGDMVILVSDGVTQDWPCGDGDFFLAQQIGKLSVSSPVDMANHLLRYAIGQCQGKIRDDMTILVTGIWENREDM